MLQAQDFPTSLFPGTKVMSTLGALFQYRNRVVKHQLGASVDTAIPATLCFVLVWSNTPTPHEQSTLY